MRWVMAFMLSAGLAQADSLVATRTIRAQTILASADMTLVAADIPGAATDIAAAEGLEARVTLYAGRPIRPDDLGPPAIVGRNQLVSLSYTAGPIAIVTEGRALARGGIGDLIPVMNLASRTTVSGRIGADGVVLVGPNS
ncbi:MAG: flagellar basal body P-ring formation chaperone FlgA [Sideroxyarcus sp.]|nr:flagellar basal body P-ring formation chaperone FlgA [Sideroxyarcus sp.]